MELFGFASGSSGSGPHFPFFPESILKGYPSDLMEHPTIPSLPMSSTGFTSTDFLSLYHSLLDTTSCLWQKPLTRQVAYGVLAVVLTCGIWKVTLVWRGGSGGFSLDSKSEINLDVEVQKRPSFSHVTVCKKAEGDVPLTKPPSSQPEPLAVTGPERVTTAEVSCITQTLPQRPDRSESATSTSDIGRVLAGGELTSATQKFQRQLIEALSRLDDVRFRLKELESEKELLSAEIDLRKKMIHKLQDENTSERDKRQQAELRMEMMEIENSQLRHMRKELSLRTGQVERLEKFLKEKEALQEKLFEENVVLPRGVAETRAREFGILQTRIQKLESELASSKHLQELEMRCQPSKSSCAVRSNSPATATTRNRKKKGSQTRSQAASDVKTIPCGTVLCRSPHKRRNLHGSRSQSPSEHIITGLPLTTTKTDACSPTAIVDEGKMAVIELEQTAESTHPEGEILPADKVSLKIVMKDQHNSQENPSTPLDSNSCSDNAESAQGSSSSSQTKGGVFAQLKAFITGYKGSSSDSDCGNLALGPGILDDLLTGSDRSRDDKANNNVLRSDASLLSDGQSSVFMSASGGSVASGEDKKKSRNRSKKTSAFRKGPRYSRGRMKDKERVSKRRAGQGKRSRGTAAVPPKASDNVLSLHQSSNTSMASTAKNVSPELHQLGRSDLALHPCLSDLNDNQNKDYVLSSDSSDGHDADSGDSWIVIKPSIQ